MSEKQIESQPTSESNDSPVSLAALDEGAELPEGSRKRNRRRKLLVTLLILLLLGVTTTVGGYFLLRGERVDLRAKQKLPEKIASGQDIKQAAFDSLSNSLAAPLNTPSPTNQSPTETATAGKFKEEKIAAPFPAGMTTTLTAPPEAFTTSSPVTESTPTPNKAPLAPSVSATSVMTTERAAKVSSSNQSIRFASLAQMTSSKAPIDAPPISKTASMEPTRIALDNQTNLPSFGAMLPVRLLGVLYTLRQGTLARLELTRDLKTARWQLRRGTILVGQVQSGVRDRAYLQINGLLDPRTHVFTKLTGEVLGNDGGAGLRGKQRRIASAWSKVLDRTAAAGVQIATGVLNRRSASVIVAADPAETYRSATGNASSRDEQTRDFVEVPAGTTGFVLVTTLPPTTDAAHFTKSIEETSNLPDQELATLLMDANPVQIRAALPHMPPALQRIAQMVLKELEAEQP